MTGGNIGIRLRLSVVRQSSVCVERHWCRNDKDIERWYLLDGHSLIVLRKMGVNPSAMTRQMEMIRTFTTRHPMFCVRNGSTTSGSVELSPERCESASLRWTKLSATAASSCMRADVHTLCEPTYDEET